MNNQQTENTQEIKLPHEQARDYFMSIQKQSGAAIKPIGVFQFFYNYKDLIRKLINNVNFCVLYNYILLMNLIMY